MNKFLGLPRGNQSFEICMIILVPNQSILYQSSFEELSLGNILNYGNYLKNIKTVTTLKTNVYVYIRFK